MKRWLTMLLSVVLLLSLLPAATVSAAEKEVILLAGSDFQVSNHNTTHVEQVLSTLALHGISKADGAFFCGDYTLNSVDENNGQSSAGLGVLKQLFAPVVGDRMTFVQGNHDPEDTVGLSKSGNNDPISGKYGVYVIHEDEYLQYDWAYSRDIVKETAANLKKYLDAKAKAGWTKPIFVLSHVGLHWGNRTRLEGSAVHGDLLVDVLNEAGEKGLNVIFLYGHDHSGGYADFIGGSAVYFKKGDKIEVCTGQKKEHETRTLKFTYMNAGYIGYYSTGDSSAPSDCDATVTMSVFRVRGDEVIITRYDGNVNLAKKQYGIHNLKSKGAYSQYFYDKHGYHVDLNTIEYTSSRKVTATNDVHVDTPMPKVTTTTQEYTATSVGNGMVVQKTTAGKDRTTAKQNATDPTQPTGEGGTADDNSTATENGTVPTDADGNEVAEDATDPDQAADADRGSAAQGIPGWVWIFPVVGGLVLVGSVVALIITTKKKK